MKPFLIESSSQFRSKGPDALTSRQYARDFDEVKAFGSRHATRRGTRIRPTPRATGRRTRRTPGAGSSARSSAQQGLSLADNARLFAMLYLTAADALITVWDDKAHYGFWRPITAIRAADTDGNAARRRTTAGRR